MSMETVIGLSMLTIAVVGYFVHYAVSSVNWSFIRFCMRKDI
jgi:hypothetical protein